MIFDDLVLRYAHTRFLHGHFRQGDTAFVRGGSRREKYSVHLFLREQGEFRLRRTHFREFCLQRFHAVDDIVSFKHRFPPLFFGKQQFFQLL